MRSPFPERGTPPDWSIPPAERTIWACPTHSTLEALTIVLDTIFGED